VLLQLTKKKELPKRHHFNFHLYISFFILFALITSHCFYSTPFVFVFFDTPYTHNRTVRALILLPSVNATLNSPARLSSIRPLHWHTPPYQPLSHTLIGLLIRSYAVQFLCYVVPFLPACKNHVKFLKLQNNAGQTHYTYIYGTYMCSYISPFLIFSQCVSLYVCICVLKSNQPCNSW